MLSSKIEKNNFQFSLERDLLKYVNFIEKKSKEMRELYNTLSLEKKLNITNKEIHFEIEMVLNKYLPNILENYANFGEEYRNRKKINVDGKELTIKQITIENLENLSKQVVLLEERMNEENEFNLLVQKRFLQKKEKFNGEIKDLIKKVEVSPKKNVHEKEEGKEKKKKEVVDIENLVGGEWEENKVRGVSLTESIIAIYTVVVIFLVVLSLLFIEDSIDSQKKVDETEVMNIVNLGMHVENYMLTNAIELIKNKSLDGVGWEKNEKNLVKLMISQYELELNQRSLNKKNKP